MINITFDDTIAVNMAIRTSRILTIPFVDSKALAMHVVMYRLFGIDKEFSLLCMLELSNRRQFDFDNFEYESFIDSEVKKINITPQLSTSNITNAILSINGMVKSKKNK